MNMNNQFFYGLRLKLKFYALKSYCGRHFKLNSLISRVYIAFISWLYCLKLKNDIFFT